MSAAASLHQLLVPNDNRSKANDRKHDVLPFVPLFTRLLHARESSDVPTDSRRTLKDLLHDQPDATLGKEYAVAFRQIASIDTIIQKAGSFDPSVFPDSDGDDHVALRRIEWTLGTLYVALESRREDSAHRLPWICGIANHSHVLELQCILHHALSSDWIPLSPPLVSLLLESSIGRTLLVGLVQNDPSAASSIVELVLLAMRRQVDVDTHMTLVAIADATTPHAVRRQCIVADFPYAAAVALDITCRLLHDTPVFLNGVMQGTKHATLWSVVTEALTQDPTTPFRRHTSAILGRVRLELQQALEAFLATKPVDVVAVLKAYCGLVGRGSLAVTDVECSLLFRVIGQECHRRRQDSGGGSSHSRFVQVAFTTIVLVCLSTLSQPVDAAATQVTKDARHLIGLLYTLDTSKSGSLFLITALLLYTKIHKASLPIHPMLPNLVMELVENHVTAFDKATQQSSIPPLRPAMILPVLLAVLDIPYPEPPSHLDHLRSKLSNLSLKSSNVWATATLLLVYVLHFNRRHVTDTASRKYDLHALPIAHIYRTASRYCSVGDAFEFVFPVLSRLVLDECPYVLSSLSVVTSQPSPASLSILPPTHVSLGRTYGHLKKTQQTIHMPVVVDLLCDLDLLPIDQAIPWLTWLVETVLPVAMGSSPPFQEPSTLSMFKAPKDKLLARPSTALAFPEVCGLIQAVWTRSADGHPTPHALQLHLVHALCPDGAYSFQDLVQEPFSILRCDPRVWRHGSLLQLLLSLLTTFRDVSSVHLRQLHADDALHPSTVDVNQFILVQDAIIVHALLNVIARLDAEDAYPQFRLLVKELPAMYDLLPSIPDLLSANDLAQLSFRCHLASALCREYPDAVSTAVAQTADKFLSTQVVEFLTAVLPALGAMAVAFCDIAEECVQLLMKLRVQINHQMTDTLNNNTAVSQLEGTVQRVFAQIVRSTHES
ncbi:hypothetical protein DYB34_002166 [Aphanomyces astaci]|uniref:Uncharacterized protein n=1 Tax=Aphanomyces astaci TaxID=112090 RepID=A0A418CE00_APHAT|nr:hypothetical protein DYB34_002166 [Aphanomyces astaci]